LSKGNDKKKKTKIKSYELEFSEYTKMGRTDRNLDQDKTRR